MRLVKVKTSRIALHILRKVIKIRVRITKQALNRTKLIRYQKLRGMIRYQSRSPKIKRLNLSQSLKRTILILQTRTSRDNKTTRVEYRPTRLSNKARIKQLKKTKQLITMKLKSNLASKRRSSQMRISKTKTRLNRSTLIASQTTTR